MLKQSLLRVARTTDLVEMKNLLKNAKQQMQLTGVQQWTSQYPTDSELRIDIQAASLLVLGEPIIGAVTVVQRTDVWVFKRLMVHEAGRGRGLATKILSELMMLGASQGVQHFQIATHPTNVAMVHLLRKLNFQECGRYIAPGREQLGEFIQFDRLTVSY
ncbi:GNAT family N-acetyltransferase [Levilactobacillus brevis]|uniref:GNAT family N-acetyltransferase n=1 Tax=Levilactobacillus brevis TaxID=1580 RepID=A0AA41JSY6_LEVBR|nr:GNAT family N-acetyltransferase [Levilactobacillus brevis]KID43513.1 Histone acetyltransferase HPA2 and related acetyltransferase [Levilactobacillus brevis]MBS0946926.1 GNAT family N-acetyltransferase [Levilactobacillus brevis]MBS0977572.1 GNAT family N-acetyltransferase [Levilactobacillus brevis]MBS1010073.1 GNAT family N-acetyltransferase [Levilactobacillus brevis]MCU0200693.1 GNAT family N-acetyltransferase [Levilactobacillus brevis]